MGVNVVDSWRTYLHHCKHNHWHKRLALIPFAKMMTHDMLTNNLNNQEELHDSFLIGKHLLNKTQKEQNRPTLQTENSTTTTTTPNNNMSPHVISNWIKENKQMVRDEMTKHILVKMDEKERRDKSTFQTKQAVCSMPNCEQNNKHVLPGLSCPNGTQQGMDLQAL